MESLIAANKSKCRSKYTPRASNHCGILARFEGHVFHSNSIHLIIPKVCDVEDFHSCFWCRIGKAFTIIGCLYNSELGYSAIESGYDLQIYTTWLHI